LLRQGDRSAIDLPGLGREWPQRCRLAPHLIDGNTRDAAQIAERGPLQTPDTQSNEAKQEAAKIRRLQIMISMVMSVISQDPNLTVEEASELVGGTKRAALAMFPDKELAYDIIYRPRLQRLMRERYHLQ